MKKKKSRSTIDKQYEKWSKEMKFSFIIEDPKVENIVLEVLKLLLLWDHIANEGKPLELNDFFIEALQSSKGESLDLSEYWENEGECTYFGDYLKDQREGPINNEFIVNYLLKNKKYLVNKDFEQERDLEIYFENRYEMILREFIPYLAYKDLEINIYENLMKNMGKFIGTCRLLCTVKSHFNKYQKLFFSQEILDVFYISKDQISLLDEKNKNDPITKEVLENVQKALNYYLNSSYKSYIAVQKDLKKVNYVNFLPLFYVYNYHKNLLESMRQKKYQTLESDLVFSKKEIKKLSTEVKLNFKRTFG